MEEEREQEDGSRRSSLIVYSEPLSAGMQSLLAFAPKLTFNLKQRPPYISADYTFTVIVDAMLLRSYGTRSREEEAAGDRVPGSAGRNNPLAGRSCSCRIM